MEEIELENAEEGMVLARDVEDEDGRVLMKKGNELTESMIDSIQSRGVETIYVSPEEEQIDQLSEEEREEKKTEIEEQLDHMYEPVEDDEIMVKIRDMSKEYLTSKYETNS